MSFQGEEQRRVAIVTPWFGEEMKGGAEQQARELAHRISRLGIGVDVLTTCSEGFLSSWDTNVFPEGCVEVNHNLSIYRFPVSKRNAELFHELNGRLLAARELIPGLSPIDEELESIWRDQNIFSEDLEDFLRENQSRYRGIIFLPYLYGTSLRGALHLDNSFLMPCLHDEVYAYLHCVSDVVHAVKGLLFLSEGEQLIAAKIFGPVAFAKGIVVGAGVEPLGESAENSDLDLERYILCLGRKSPEKGTQCLAEAFHEYRNQNPTSNLKLIFAGPGDALEPQSDVIDMGLVSEEVKKQLLAGCLALMQPSRNESFSRVMYEAWFESRPVIVNELCDATRIAVESSKGGWAGSDTNWIEDFQQIDQMSLDELNSMGRIGCEYSEANVTWDAAISRTVDALRDENRADTNYSKVSFVQLLPNLSFGDAISNQAIFLSRELQSRGYHSQIMVRADHIDPRVAEHCLAFDPAQVSNDDCLIYHHSIGSEITDFVIDFQGRKCMIYHNITPPEFFSDNRPELARLLRDGLEQLWRLADSIPLAFSDSNFNGKDLERYGFDSPVTVPLPVDPKQWLERPDPQFLRHLATYEGRNIVFVGRYSPNKRQVDLIRVLSWICQMSADCRLILAGFGVDSDPYVQAIKTEITTLGLSDRVMLTGHLSESELLAVYFKADVFLSLSQHEGFGVPLLEAMWFDVPVIALRYAAVGETLAGAGILLGSECTLRDIAAVVLELLDNKELKHKVIVQQRKRRVKNLPENLQTEIDAMLEGLQRYESE